MKEMSHAPSVPYHQGGPVGLTVESKLRATGILVQDHPQHDDTVLLIYRVVRVNETEYLILLL